MDFLSKQKFTVPKREFLRFKKPFFFNFIKYIYLENLRGIKWVQHFFLVFSYFRNTIIIVNKSMITFLNSISLM